MGFRILEGDALQVLKTLPDNSIQCVVTSPPYWGLRDYGTATWEGGSGECDHKVPLGTKGGNATGTKQTTNPGSYGYREWLTCGRCGAKRIDSQIGLESTPEEYVGKMVAVFREVRRVLRDDGTVWLNLGDSYAGSWGNYGGQNRGDGTQRAIESGSKAHQEAYDGLEKWRPPTSNKMPGIKPKDLIGIPWRAAFALQADGWYLRSDIIWSKPNPMPESVTDRCTKAHEYIFLLSKSERYYYDADAVKERAIEGEDLGLLRTKAPGPSDTISWHAKSILDRQNAGIDSHTAGSGFRNKRTVWTVATQPFPDAHFATFPEALIQPCILAGTSEHGCCSRCGAPWERVTESETSFQSGSGKSGHPPNGKNGTDYVQALSGDYDIRMGPVKETRTIGWEPACSCESVGIERCTVLDPFSGSGTTGVVALRYHRDFIGIELNPEYAAMARRRIVGDAPLFNSQDESSENSESA